MDIENQKVIKWEPGISVGDEIIDNQHKGLLKQMGVLAFALRSGEADDKIEEVLSFLEDYIQSHFKYEERYMRENNYPDLGQHISQHEEFNKNFFAFKSEWFDKNHNKLELAKKVDEYMHDWWINHIANVDKKYADFISKNSSSGEQAWYKKLLNIF